MTPRRALSGFLLTGIVTLVLAMGCSTTQRESVEQPEDNVDADTGSAFAGGSDATEKSPKPTIPPPELEIIDILPKDAIPAILHPTLIDSGQASMQMLDDEMVIGLTINGESRAYSVPHLSNHEIVNDVAGGRPVVVTW